MSNNSLQAYWTASKCRLDRWASAMKTMRQHDVRGWSHEHARQRALACALLEEVLTGELLTRVWTGVVCGFEQRETSNEAEPVVRSVLVGHLEARHRALQLLVSGQCLRAEDVVSLNRLRRRTECWTDMLLGYLMPVHDAREFAFDPVRARDFAQGLQDERQQAWGRHAWPLVISSLRAAFATGMCTPSPNIDLNRRIASSVLACFGPDLFDSTGQFRSLWQLRLTNTTSDALGMIDQLLVDNSNHSAVSSGVDGRVRRDFRAGPHRF